MKRFKELLSELEACNEAVIWAEDKTVEQVVKQCPRGDWLLWLAKKIDVDIRPLTKAKALCALTVRHLMKDERSINVCDVALRFSDGKATTDELKNAADASADASAYAAYAAYASAAAADASAYAADAADAAADAAYAAYASAAADAAADAAAAYAADAAADADAADARTNNRMKTANICREVIGQLIIDKVNEKFKD